MTDPTEVAKIAGGLVLMALAGCSQTAEPGLRECKLKNELTFRYIQGDGDMPEQSPRGILYDTDGWSRNVRDISSCRSLSEHLERKP